MGAGQNGHFRPEARALRETKDNLNSNAAVSQCHFSDTDYLENDARVWHHSFLSAKL